MYRSLTMSLALALTFATMASAANVAHASESWATDQRTATKIGWVSSTTRISAGTWSGGSVLNKADGKGHLAITIHDLSGLDQTVEGEVTMAAGLITGVARLKWSDGATYAGTYHLGMRDGNGVMKWPDGGFFDGNWARDEPHGVGVRRWPDGSIYDGHWVGGFMDGSGSFRGSDGSQYIGTFHSNFKHGHGIMTWQTGQKYEGSFSRGQMEGLGKLTFANGVTYTGTFLSGRPEGSGELQSPDGRSLFKGSWIGSARDFAREY